MFKVGDRVWLKPHKITGIVVDVKYSEKGLPYEWYIDIGGHKNVRYDLYNKSNLTYSAQTMFEALGYMQYDIKDTHYIEHEKNGDIIKIKNNKIVECLLYVPNVIGKLKAINQMCIEKGWLE